VIRSFLKLSALLPFIAHVFLFVELFLTLAERRLLPGGRPLESSGGCRPPLSDSKDKWPARRGGVPCALASPARAGSPPTLRARLPAQGMEVLPVYILLLRLKT